MPQPSKYAGNYTPEGRLADDDATLGSDHRSNRKLVAAVKAAGLDARQPDSGLTMKSSLQDIKDFIAPIDIGMQQMYDAADMSLPDDDKEAKVEHSVTTIKGEDDHEIKLHVFRVAGTEDKKLPCVLYTHGGGMTIINTINPVHERWAKSLALGGVVSIAVDFRNAYTKEKHNPFPLGLNDCAAVAKYIASHKSEFGISTLTIQGESGGGNLAIATVLKASKEGWKDSIDGLFACVPYISNAWGRPKEDLIKELPSTVASDGYFLGLKWMELMGHYYTPTPEHARDSLAWPYYATEEELKGFPPTYVVVDELDPLRDEGMEFYRKLSRAGVDVHAHMNLGLAHGTWLIMRKALPDANRAMIDAVVGFAKRV